MLQGDEERLAVPGAPRGALSLQVAEGRVLVKAVGDEEGMAMEGVGNWLPVWQPDSQGQSSSDWRVLASPSGWRSSLGMSGKLSRGGHPYRDGRVLAGPQLGLAQLLNARAVKGMARLGRVSLCKDWSTSGHRGLPLGWQRSEAMDLLGLPCIEWLVGNLRRPVCPRQVGGGKGSFIYRVAETWGWEEGKPVRDIGRGSHRDREVGPGSHSQSLDCVCLPLPTVVGPDGL